MKPFNTLGGFRLHQRGFGVHYDLASHQRVIGKHVYVFRTLPDRIDVWRSDMADEHDGYRWTLAHRVTQKPGPCGHCHSTDGPPVDLGREDPRVP